MLDVCEISIFVCVTLWLLDALEVLAFFTIIFWILGLIYALTPLEPFAFFYHDILGWHKPMDKEHETFDGCYFHNKCKFCHKEIMQDSQGNWF